jgi:hypothetical protein
VRVKEGRLTEVWVCLDLDFKLAACRGGNGAADDAVVKVTPMRRDLRRPTGTPRPLRDPWAHEALPSAKNRPYIDVL